MIILRGILKEIIWEGADMIDVAYVGIQGCVTVNTVISIQDSLATVTLRVASKQHDVR